MVLIKLNKEQFDYAKDYLVKDTAYEHFFDTFLPDRDMDIAYKDVKELCDISGTNEGFIVMDIDTAQSIEEKQELERQLRICSQLTEIFAGRQAT